MEIVQNVRRKLVRAGKVPGPRAGWTTQGACQLCALGRTILDASFLLFVTGRYELRTSCLLSYSPIAQSMLISGWETALARVCRCTHAPQDRGIGSLVAVAGGGGQDVPYVDTNAIDPICLHRPCAGGGRQVVAAVDTWFLEVLFDRSFQGLPLALKADVRHPFAEPGEPLATLEHRTERVEQSRERTMAAVKEALERLLMWARQEHSEYLSRVVYWETCPPTQ